MQALILEGYRNLQVKQLSDPEIGPQEVLIRVRACRICGSDIHGYDGSVAVNIGAGMIGLLALQVFRHFRCDRIISVDVDAERLELARKLSADETVLGSGPEAVAQLQASTAGQGPDIAVEAVGAQAPIVTAIECVRCGGTVTLIGNLAR